MSESALEPVAKRVYELFRQISDDPDLVPWEEASGHVRILWRAALYATAKEVMLHANSNR